MHAPFLAESQALQHRDLDEKEQNTVLLDKSSTMPTVLMNDASGHPSKHRIDQGNEASLWKKGVASDASSRKILNAHVQTENSYATASDMLEQVSTTSKWKPDALSISNLNEQRLHEHAHLKRDLALNTREKSSDYTELYVVILISRRTSLFFPFDAQHHIKPANKFYGYCY